MAIFLYPIFIVASQGTGGERKIVEQVVLWLIDSYHDVSFAKLSSVMPHFLGRQRRNYWHGKEYHSQGQQAYSRRRFLPISKLIASQFFLLSHFHRYLKVIREEEWRKEQREREAGELPSASFCGIFLALNLNEIYVCESLIRCSAPHYMLQICLFFIFLIVWGICGMYCSFFLP